MSAEYPVLGDRPIDQWKVTELKEELRRRRLPIKGLKDDLVRRLFDAISSESELQDDEPENGLNPDSDAHDLANETTNSDSEVQDEKTVETTDQRTEHSESGTIHDDSVADAGKDVEAHVVSDGSVDAGHVHPMDEEPAALSTPLETSSTEPNVLNTLLEPNSETAETNETDEDTKSLVHDSDVIVNDDDTKTELAVETHDKHDEHSKSASENATLDEPKEVSETKLHSKPANENATVDEPKEVSETKFDSNIHMVTEKDTSLDSTCHVKKGDTEVPSEDVAKSQYDSNNQVSESKPDLGLQVSNESISTNSISVNEKKELNDNINTDNLNIEVKVVKTEMVLPSSSETTIGGDLHMEDVIKHEENQFPPIEESGLEKTRDSEADLKIDNADGGYSEKINLDRSSGDESMEEDVLESKIEENSTPIEEKAASVHILNVEEASQHEGKIAESSISKNATVEEEAKPVILTEKRKLSGTEPGVAEPAKRRRWSTDTVKIPERQYSNLSLTDTSKDPILPTPKRVIARSDSSVKVDGEKERTVPPSSRPPTTSLRVDRFLRPFTLKAAQEMLSKNGKICSFWMDNIKTHCYVTFSSEEEAAATRNAVYNLQWPPNGGRLLVAEFVDPQEVKMRLEAPPESPAPVTPSPKTSLQQPLVTTQQPTRQLSSRQLPPAPPMLSAPLVPPNTQLPRERPAIPPPAAKEPEAPILTLDDLFMKTKATPRIYYLPLSEEQVAAKRANQFKTARS